MAATTADTQHQIGQLRGDMNAVLDEVEHRLRGGLRGVASAETRLTSRRAREGLVQGVRKHAPVAGVVAATAVSAAAYGGYALFARLRERRRPQLRLKRSLGQFRAGLGAGVQNVQRHAERVQRRGLLLRLEPQDGGYVRVSEARIGGVPHNRRKQTTLVKKLFWAGLVSVLMTLGSVLARRVADGVWRATIHEAPPEHARNAAA
jgi:hypothetical protein